MAYAADLAAIQTNIQSGRFDIAIEALDNLLAASPQQADALYMKAVCQRYLQKFDGALQTLRSLRAIKPDFGRAYQEEAHIYRDRQQWDRAFAAYQLACQFNPSLDASWRGQADILRRHGRTQEADQAQMQSDYLKTLPHELHAVMNMTYEGALLKAEKLCRFYLQNNPHHVEAMRLLADLGVRLGSLDDADFLLESALAFDSENIRVRLDYVQVLRKQQKYEAAFIQAKYLLDKDPENATYRSLFAIESMFAGNYVEAIALFDKTLTEIPNDPATLTSRGHALKTFGDQAAAVQSYQRAYRHKPNHGEAYYSLANLKTYRYTTQEIDLMREQYESHDLTHQSRVYICFALGKAYEDQGDYEQSFSFYRQGNALKEQQTSYQPEDMKRELEAQVTVCDNSLFSRQGNKGYAANDPIFIVGLPRAGSTLLEQILASHSQVDGTLELPNILSLSHRLRGRERIAADAAYPRILHELSSEQLYELGKAYIEGTRFHRKGAPYFIDKMPNNFRHIGLIHLILPNAKIIDARRHPMACCFSGFKQLFAEGQEFSYGLDRIGQYYRDYVAMMDHWDNVLPGRILRVHYEHVVFDIEAQARRILDYLGLEYEESCIEFYKNKRSVRTASSEQVRRPIYQTGLAQWRYYEPWLGPLKDALGPVLDRYPVTEG